MNRLSPINPKCALLMQRRARRFVCGVDHSCARAFLATLENIDTLLP
jgi:hypothetical protein